MYSSEQLSPIFPTRLRGTIFMSRTKNTYFSHSLKGLLCRVKQLSGKAYILCCIFSKFGVDFSFLFYVNKFNIIWRLSLKFTRRKQFCFNVRAKCHYNWICLAFNNISESYKHWYLASRLIQDCGIYLLFCFFPFIVLIILLSHFVYQEGPLPRRATHYILNGKLHT